MCGFFFGIPLKCGLFYECAWFFRFVVAWPGENPFWTWSMPRKCVISRFPCILPEVPSQWIENQDATNKEFLSSSGIAARPSVWNRYIKVARQLGNSLEVWLFRRNRTIANITIWLFNIAMENGPFIDGLPIKMVDLSMAMLEITRGQLYSYMTWGLSLWTMKCSAEFNQLSQLFPRWSALIHRQSEKCGGYMISDGCLSAWPSNCTRSFFEVRETSRPAISSNLRPSKWTRPQQ